MITAIIVEDDPFDGARTHNLLQECSNKVMVKAICTNIDDAANAIQNHKPDLVFLDIVLGRGETGFDLLRRFDRPEFAVIFTTQHNNTSNAIGAIRACALDFLPKPILPEEINAAVGRYLDNRMQSAAQIRSLKENLESENKQLKEVWISGTDGRTRLEIQNIIYCESDNSSTTFFLQTPVNRRSTFVSSLSIKDWEHQLENTPICRVHRSFLVNLAQVEKYRRNFADAKLTLKNGKIISVSRTRKAEVKARLKFYNK
jgi:two-component system LytT family response regulator